VTAPHLAAGHQVAGRYTIRSLLSFTSEVASYQAVSNLGHEVAVRLYDPAIAQRADIMGKLEQVRAQLAGLQHPGFVPILDHGYDQQTGAPFSVTELINMPSLAQLVEQGSLALPVVARIISNLGQVLDLAHAQQLFHRALSPNNIFVGPAPDYTVRLSDFGSAIVRSTTSSHEAYARSAPWWAPEQLQPSAVVTGAADVFTSALLSFFALTGRPYWIECHNPQPNLQTLQNEIMGQRVEASRRAGEFGCVIAANVDHIFSRSLSINQADRPRTVGEFGQTLMALSSTSGANKEVAKTLAFPEMELAAAGAPAPPGGAGYGASVGYAAPGAHVAAGGYVAPAPTTQLSPSPVQPNGAFGEIPAGADGAPGLPPFPQAKPQKKGPPIVPIAIGVGSALLLALVLFLVLASDGDGDSAAADATPNPSASATTTPPPLADDDDDDDDDDPKTASAAASSSSDKATQEDAPVEVTVTCMPSCDSFWVDGKEYKDYAKDTSKPLALDPGVHTLEARKRGYIGTKRKVTVEAGKPLSEAFALRKIPRTRRRRKKKRCGRFVKCR
jgi:eukaryotic-like serine/threonine-protein kinase